jgi:hypothetical protein
MTERSEGTVDAAVLRLREAEGHAVVERSESPGGAALGRLREAEGQK